jgi:tetratricopeptide (TPR) repeat protein
MNDVFDNLLSDYKYAVTLTQKGDKLLDIISFLRYRDEADLTKFYCEELLRIAEKLHSDFLFSRAYDALSAMYFYIESYDRALDYAFLALELNKRRMYNDQVAINCHIIGLVYYLLDDYQNAESYFLESLKYNPDFLNVHCNIARLYSDKKDFAKSEKYISKALILSEKLRVRELKSFVFYNKAIIEERQDYLFEAQKSLDVCFTLIDATIDSYQYLNVCNEQAVIHLKKKEFETALKVLDIAVDKAQQTNRNAQLQKSWQIISEVYYSMAEYAKACYFHRLSSELKMKIFNRQISEKYTQLKINYDAEIEKLKMLEIISHSAQTTSLGIVSAGIVHEINQPLSAIKINNDSMLYWSKRNPGQIPDFILNQLTNISESVREINNLISQIKKFWKTSEHKENFHNLNLKEVFENILKLYRKKFNQNNVVFDFKNDINDNYIVCFDTVLLEQIFLYILNMISDIYEYYNHCQKHFCIRFEQGIDDINLFFEFDFLIDDLLICDDNILDKNRLSIAMNYRIAKYYLERYTGLLVLKSDYLTKKSILRFSLPINNRCKNA